MNIVKISDLNNRHIEELHFFLEKNNNAIQSFRYYNKRDFSVIKNHICTFLYYIKDEVIGYGHLDFYDDKIWLGIMVGDNHIGLGLGSQIMNHLIQQTLKPIFLSVDKTNHRAQHLYNKFNFVIIEENDKNYIMLKNG